MDDFTKFQPHPTADDETVMTHVLEFSACFMSFSSPFNYVFEFSLKLRFFQLNFSV